VSQAEGLKSQVEELRCAASNRTESMDDRLAASQASHEQAKR
jgi:hypothetical protein